MDRAGAVAAIWLLGSREVSGATMRTLKSFAAVCLTTLLPACVANAEDFDTWLQAQIGARAAAAIGSRSPSNQLEAPAMSANSSTLVDSTSASDVIGIAVNLAGLSGSTDSEGDADTNAATATVSGYALFSAVVGRDPLDPLHYCEPGSQRARWLSATIGFEDKEGEQDRTILAGGKFVIPFTGLRNVCDPTQFSDIQAKLEAAVIEFQKSRTYVEDALVAAMARQRKKQLSSDEEDALLNSLDDPAARKEIFDELSEPVVQGILDEHINTEADAALQQQVAKAVREFEGRPRIALEFLTKQTSGEGDVYSAKGILDLGLSEGLTLTLNGGWERVTRAGKDSQGGMLALAFNYSLRDLTLDGARPVRFGLSGDAKWMDETPDIYRGQAKVTIPIADGIELPLSMTVANRSELVDEAEVRGLIGFTVDTARLRPLLRGIGTLLGR